MMMMNEGAPVEVRWTGKQDEERYKVGRGREQENQLSKWLDEMLEEWFIEGWGAVYHVSKQEKCGTKKEDKERGMGGSVGGVDSTRGHNVLSEKKHEL